MTKFMTHLPRLKNIDPLVAPRWVAGGHMQTIISHLIPSPTVKKTLQEFNLPLKDGDQLKVYFREGEKPVIVTLFHGLGGNINSDYMQRTALVAESLGFGFMLVNHRGAHTGLPLAKSPYHSGRGEDASDVFEWQLQKYPNHFQIGIGVSMSGSILLNLLSGRRGEVKPNAVITVNAPLDLMKGSLQLQQGLNRLYDFRFVQRLRKDLHAKHKLGLLDKEYRVPFWSTMHDFDSLFTGPATEFQTRENYYSTCSMKDHLEKIDRPCILLSAADDPFVDVGDYLEAKKSKFVSLHIEKTGGHVGYLGIDPSTGKIFRWLDYFLGKTIQDMVLKQGLL